MDFLYPKINVAINHRITIRNYNNSVGTRTGHRSETKNKIE